MSEHTIGDGPIDPQYMAVMRTLAEVLHEAFNGPVPIKEGTVGFVLLVFPFGTHQGRCNYISNADRSDIKTMLKEQLARFEGMPAPTGAG